MIKFRKLMPTGWWVEFDCEGIKEFFKRAGNLQEVLAIDHCEACGSNNIQPQHRENSGYDFYEIKCLDCYARLSMGQSKDTVSLFPSRRDNQGRTVGTNGWEKWSGNSNSDQKAEEPPDENMPF